MDAHTATTLTNEAARVAVLGKLGVLGTAAEQAFDDLTALAALLCGTAEALITLAYEGRPIVTSARSSCAAVVVREDHFWAYTLSSRETLMVEDALQDARFAQGPLVVNDRAMRFYAGAPILGENGDVFGTLSVLDEKPRALRPEQQQALEALARQATELLRQRLLVRQLQSSVEEVHTKTLQLGLAVEAGCLGVYTWDVLEDTTVWQNERMYEIFGRTREQGSLGSAQILRDVVAPEDRQSFLEATAKVTCSGARLQWVGRLHDPDGALRWVEVKGLAVTQPKGTLMVVGTVADITEHKQAELTAQVNRERLEFALAGGEASTFDWYPDGDLIHWGGALPFGCPASQVSSVAAVLNVVHPEDRTRVSDALSEAVNLSKDYACDFRAFWPDGSMHWVRGIGRMLHFDSEAPKRFVGVNSDITERKLAEETMLQTEKLAAVSKLASVMSHEINNPLEAVTNLLYIVRSSPTISRDDREHLESADRELSRVVELTAQTLRTHRNTEQPTEISADTIVQEIVSLYRGRLTASGIRTRLNLQEGVSFQAFEGDIRQVLRHLVANAFDAMRHGGTLRIRSRYATDERTGQKGASISIADDGPGIPENFRNQLFQAFHSTKDIHGTGLGLWISQRIVHKHRGHLRIRTSTGSHHGTVVRMWIPLKAAATESWRFN